MASPSEKMKASKAARHESGVQKKVIPPGEQAALAARLAEIAGAVGVTGEDMTPEEEELDELRELFKKT